MHENVCNGRGGVGGSLRAGRLRGAAPCVEGKGEVYMGMRVR